MKRREFLGAGVVGALGQVVGLAPNKALAATQAPERLVWDRRTNNLPVLLVGDFQDHARRGTLPDRAEFRFERPDGALWGGLQEPVTIQPRDWVKLFPREPWRAEVRPDLFRLAWCLHRIEVREKGVDGPMAVRLLTYRSRALTNQGFIPQWLPPVEKMPVIAIQWMV